MPYDARSHGKLRVNAISSCVRILPYQSRPSTLTSGRSSPLTGLRSTQRHTDARRALPHITGFANICTPSGPGPSIRGYDFGKPTSCPQSSMHFQRQALPPRVQPRSELSLSGNYGPLRGDPAILPWSLTPNSSKALAWIPLCKL